MLVRHFPARSLLLLAAITIAPLPAAAKTIHASQADLSEQLESLQTGDQLVAQEQVRTVRFAGRDVVLDDATAVFGYASEIAYMAVVEGQASLGALTAQRGKMLLIPPFGGEPTVERFDAARLSDALSEEAEMAGTPLVASLESLARDQRRGVFLGRFARTYFNVATLGSAEAELDRRSRVGGNEVRGARFAPPEPGGDIEQGIVERFLTALAAANAEAVAQYLDPLPYGYGNMTSGGGEARQRMAEALIAERDWQAFAAASPVRASESSWVASGGTQRATIELRRTTDFAFVHSVEVGG